MTPETIQQNLTFLHDKKLIERIIETSELLHFEKGDSVVREGQYIKVLPIVLKGNVRVFQAKEDREILLYYVMPQQTCMMSLSASFFNHTSPSQAVAVEKTSILAIPADKVRDWQKEFPSWNDFVIRTFRNRYDELLETFESVAFDHIHERVWDYLQKRLEGEMSRFVVISHQQLAYELGTTRVVISRILKQYEEEGKLTLHRGQIEMH